MSKRAFTLKNSDGVAECPKCKNNEKFIAISEQVAEDGCVIYVECYNCNYNPFDTIGSCIESVMGSLDTGNIMSAVDEWTTLINQNKSNEA